MFGATQLPRRLHAALEDARSRKASVRSSALSDLARHLQSAPSPEAENSLREALRADQHPEVRATAALAIADAGFGGADRELLAALDDGDPRVRRAALIAIGEVADRSLPGLMAKVEQMTEAPEPALRYQALVALRHLCGIEAARRLLEALDDSDEELRWVALRLLEELAADHGDGRLEVPDWLEGGLDRIGKRLQDPGPRVRLAAAILLGKMGDERAKPVLIELLSVHSACDGHDLLAAVQLVADLRLEEARPALISRARRGWGEGELGWVSLVALARLGDTHARGEVVKELAAASLARRARAVQALIDMPVPEAADSLARLLRRPRGLDPEQLREALRRGRSDTLVAEPRALSPAAGTVIEPRG